ncbi:MAG: hypothetical protein JOZ57_05845, partial [Abitibacteriaceae bacterium]|nr:hypothetical protein [Abditibacteriaceae bacterium]
DEEFRTHRNVKDFTKLIGRPHTSYFTYIAYGKSAPLQWLQQCKDAGAIPQLAWEPSSLNDVKDDEYLRNFAQACGALHWPIFLRYASEMNGAWTPWHGNPALYREKFRLVHQVFHRYAPQVATVWCVNSVPLETIASYYPGDDGCDWVGIDVYSVPFYGNNPGTPGLQDSPLHWIDPIYKMYKDRKPIAICEYGASHMAAVDKVPRPEFAIEKMALLYEALPRFYPRIKMVSWFDVNALQHQVPGTPNDYTLTDNRNVLAAYQHIIDSPYYLDQIPVRNTASGISIVMPRLVLLGQRVRGTTKFSMWVKSYVPQPKVYLAINNQIVYAGVGNGAHDVEVNTDGLGAGYKRVRVYVYDANNHFVTTAATTVHIGAGRDIERGVPLQVIGNVLRYYADRAGLVTAVDVQTPGNVATIHFAPTLAQQLMTAYPVGNEMQAWVVPLDTPAAPAADQSDAQQWNLVGTGEAEPANGFSQPYTTSDLDMLEADVTVPNGAATTVDGKLTDVVVNKAGQVVAFVVDKTTFVRVPSQFRGGAAGGTGAGTAVNLRIDAPVTISGTAETLATGAISGYKTRLVATAVTVNGRPASVLHFSNTNRVRAINRDADDTPVEDEVKDAQAAGLDVFETPLTGGSRILIRSTGRAALDELGVKPLLETNQRPW